METFNCILGNDCKNSSEIEALFSSAQAGYFDTENLKNNASLNLYAITALAEGTLPPDPRIHVRSDSVSSISASICYEIARSRPPTGGVYVEIENCADASTAQSKLRWEMCRRYCLCSNPQVPKKSEQTLGQVTLQTEHELFWVRNSVFVQLWNFETAVFPSLGAFPASPKFVSSPVNKTLLRFAHALDGHLAGGAVPPSLHLKPNTAVTFTQCTVPAFEEFSFQLVDATNTHDVKQSAPEDPSIVRQMRNGSATGVYTFIGTKVGKTKVHLFVARTDNLAVGWAEVYVEIVAPSKFVRSTVTYSDDSSTSSENSSEK